MFIKVLYQKSELLTKFFLTKINIYLFIYIYIFFLVFAHLQPRVGSRLHQATGGQDTLLQRFGGVLHMAVPLSALYNTRQKHAKKGKREAGPYVREKHFLSLDRKNVL